MVLRLSEKTITELNDLEEIRFRSSASPPRSCRETAHTWSKIDLP